ncbi:unnamed protein product [Symbiodinium microadriaticum]|nr:unnamed protein product [Symbiodinium microadriaticum]CAE7758036.1 unnamed protein product [Symbiodinium sp. KB8]
MGFRTASSTVAVSWMRRQRAKRPCASLPHSGASVLQWFGLGSCLAGRMTTIATWAHSSSSTRTPAFRL